MLIALVRSWSVWSSSSATSSSCGSDDTLGRLFDLRGSYSAIEFALNREGIAGVCGVCGEIGFPGEEDADMEVAATICGTPESRLDELGDRYKSVDDDIDSVNALFDSFMD